MTSRVLLMGLLAVGSLAWAQTPLPPPKPFQPKPPPEQPIPFSHKTHVALGVKCTDCHAIKPPGDKAGLPSEAACMGCHVSIKKDSPAIVKLAGYFQEKQPLPWVRVYKLPKTVYFSHEVHAKQAAVNCTECHGPVAEREAIGLEKSIHMDACMACHDRYKADNTCDLCHDSH